MMSTVKTKKESPSTYVNNIKPLMTLSDRLRIAGIKEYKPNVDTKPVRNSGNYYRKRKSTYKITTVRNRGNSTKDFSSKQSSKNEVFQSKIPPKNSSSPTPKLKRPVNSSTAKMLSESLNFIKDCQIYKSKLRNPKEDSQSVNQLIEKTKSDSQPKQESEKPSQKIPTPITLKEKAPNSTVAEEKVTAISVAEEKITEKSRTNENVKSLKKNNEKSFTKETVKVALIPSVEEVVKTLQKSEIIPEDLSLGNVSRIDKKYLESILSLTNSTDDSKNKTSKENFKERKKKSTGKSSTYSKTKNETDLAKEPLNDQQSEFNQIESKKEIMVRDLAKSDAQIQLRDKRHGSNQKNSETNLGKDSVHSKLEITEGRKKRKARKKSMKTSNDEVIEVPFSFENPKSNDVKELWRRDTIKKSENSLTSHSSCTVPENDVIPNWKNLELQSYRILQKLVEEEIKKISKKSENKNNTGKVKNEENNEQKDQENKPRTLKNKRKSKNNYNKLKLITPENPTDAKETILQENLQSFFLTYEGEKNKTDLLSALVKNAEKPTDSKFPEEVIKKLGKTPDQVIQNWSILNRLEQAFLALGTPTFQDEKPLKTKQGSNNNSSHNTSESVEKVPEKKEQEVKYKPQNLKNNESGPIKKAIESSTKTKLNENETVFPKKKPQYMKFPFRLTSHLKEESKIPANDTTNENDVKSKVVEETLERKGTFDIIPVKNSSVTQPQISKSCNKIDNKVDTVKKRFSQTKKQDIDLPEKQKETESSTLSEKTEKKEEKPKLQNLKPQNPKPTEKIPQIQKLNKSGIPKLKCLSKNKFEKAVLPTEVPKPPTPGGKKEPNQNSKERPVKERSILSMRGIQLKTEKFQKGEDEETTEMSTEVTTSLKSNTGDILLKIAQKNYEELVQKQVPEIKDINSVASFSETDINESQSETQKNSQMEFRDSTKRSSQETNDKITSISSLSQNTLSSPSPIYIKESSKHQTHNHHLSSWERDIYRYREIVNDIMNHYKRIDGFLKQSERLVSSSHNMLMCGSSKPCLNADDSNDDVHNISLQEYRKKIETEYQKVPFFEYKQQKREESRRRNLSVVTDIKKEMDFDVKDFQPNIKKILDSQLYVDTDNLFKRNESERKFKDKKASLKEITWDHNNRSRKKLFLRSNSMQRTLFMPRTDIFSVQSLYRREN